MKLVALALFAALAGCASSGLETLPWTGPTYTRAAISGLPTAELARMMLSPERAAEVVRHNIRTSYRLYGQNLWAIDFFQRPYILAPDICLRQRTMVGLTAVRYDRERLGQDLPTRIDRVSALQEIALVPDCAERPGRQFAHLYGEMSLVEGVQILRTLAAAQELAKGAGPLSFRLLCRPLRGEIGDCTAADRAAFAAMPLYTAYRIDRPRNPGSIQPDDHLGGDLVMFDRDGPGYWQVRMIGMGTPEATILLSAAGWVIQ